jgi:hypothetical protein
MTNETRFRAISLIRTMSYSEPMCVVNFCWQPIQVGHDLGAILKHCLSHPPTNLRQASQKNASNTRNVQNHLTKVINSGFGSLYESYQSILVRSILVRSILVRSILVRSILVRSILVRSILVRCNTTLVSTVNSKETYQIMFLEKRLYSTTAGYIKTPLRQLRPGCSAVLFPLKDNIP